MIPPLTENCPGVSTIEVFSYPSVVSFRENVSSCKVSPTLIVNIFSMICEMDLADYVLGRFSKEEQPIIRESADRAREAVCEMITHDVASAMNKFN